MIFFLQEMREQKKRITALDWSLANDQLLTSSGAVSVAVLVHQSLAPCILQHATKYLKLLNADPQRMAACVCRPMTMAYGRWHGALRLPPPQPPACFIL